MNPRRVRSTVEFQSPGPVHIFVLRRAVRFGLTTRADVLEAFANIGTTTASLALDAASVLWPSCLERRPRAVSSRLGATPPPEASEAQLVHAIETGQTSFRHTGLRAEELPLHRVQWTQNLPATPGVLHTLVSALAHHRCVQIEHVGLRYGDRYGIRTVAPVGFEQMGDQGRLIAQDLDLPEYPLRTFVLARIRFAKLIDKKLPADFIPYAINDRTTNVPVRFHPALTVDQINALARELGVNEGHVSLATRARFEYLRRFADEPPSPDAVWPPLLSIRP